MKLSSLSPEQKIKLLAELDGYAFGAGQNDIEECWRNESGEYVSSLPDYLTSYDAIIPLIQKLGEQPQRLLARHLGCSVYRIPISATPSQLCDAVLVATGKAEL